jgi:hypothetical protein
MNSVPTRRAATFLAAVAVMVSLAIAVGSQTAPGARADETAKQDTPQQDEMAELRAEIARLKSEQSLSATMRDIDYHSQNLWFSGRAGNWPLANYYLQTLQGHLHAAGTLPSSPATPGGANAQSVSARIDTANKQLAAAIGRRDVVQFQTHYRALLEGCYACHKAVGKPFLRPRMPVKPHQAIITVDPTATWPQ